MDAKVKRILSLIVVCALLTSVAVITAVVLRNGDDTTDGNGNGSGDYEICEPDDDPELVTISGYVNDNTDNEPVSNATVTVGGSGSHSYVYHESENNTAKAYCLTADAYENANRVFLVFNTTKTDENGYFKIQFDRSLSKRCANNVSWQNYIWVSISAVDYVGGEELYDENVTEYNFSLVPTGALIIKANVTNVIGGLYIEKESDLFFPYKIKDSGMLDIIYFSQVPAGEYRLVLSSVGYQTVILEDVEVKKHDANHIMVNFTSSTSNITVVGNVHYYNSGASAYSYISVSKDDQVVGLTKTDMYGDFAASIDTTGTYHFACCGGYYPLGTSGWKTVEIDHGINIVSITIDYEWIMQD
jgi:hypothetical protein